MGLIIFHHPVLNFPKDLFKKCNSHIINMYIDIGVSRVMTDSHTKIKWTNIRLV